MRNEIDLSDERPSRLSRVVVIISTLAVALIAAWVFAPILLANYIAMVPSMPKPREAVERPAAPPRAAPVAIATLSTAPATDTTAVASTQEDATPAAPAFAPQSSVAWPTEAAQEPPAQPPSMQLAAATPATATADAMENVPLPRKRPSLTIAARAAIPLPRPRPEIEGEVAPAELSAFERQVERMRE
jgi:hypothetical protein